jgi:hypothetical protein
LASPGSRSSLKDLTPAQVKGLGFNLEGLKLLSPAEQLNAITATQFENLGDLYRYSLPLLIRNFYGHRLQKPGNPWTPSRIQALTSAELGLRGPLKEWDFREIFLHAAHLSNEQLAAIDPSAMKWFWSLPLLSKEQVEVLTPLHILYLSADQLNTMSSEQVQVLQETHLRFIDQKLEVVRGLSAAFVRAIFPALTDEQIQAFQPKDISDLAGPSHSLSNLETKLALSYLDIMTPAHVQAFTPEQMACFGASNLKLLSGNKISYLLPEQISKIHESVLKKLSLQQIPHLSREQIQALTTAQIVAAFADGYQAAEDRLKALTAVQLSYFKPEQLVALPAQALGTFITPKTIPTLFTPALAQSLNKGQLSSLFATGYSAANDRLAALTPGQLGYFQAEKILELDDISLQSIVTPETLKTLFTPPFAQKMSQVQISLLFATGYSAANERLGALTPQQLRLFQPEKLVMLPNSVLVNFITPQTIPHVVTSTLVQLLSKDQIALLFATGYSAANDRLKSLSPQQMSYFQPEKLVMLSNSELRNFITPETIPHIVTSTLVQHLSKDQIAFLFATGYSAAKERLEVLSAAQFGYFQPQKLIQLSNSDLGNFLTPATIPNAFSQPLAQLLNKDQIVSLFATGYSDANDRLKKLTSKQIQYFRPEQISAISGVRLRDFLTPKNVGYLTREQVEALNEQQLKALKSNKEVTQALLSSSPNFLTSEQRKLLQ